MKDREQIFDIVNGVLAKYGIEPISEEDVAQAWDELNTPENALEARQSFNKVWQRICEQEAKPNPRLTEKSQGGGSLNLLRNCDATQ